MINFSCSCGKALVADEKYAGQMVQCPGCGNQVLIPGRRTSIQPPATSQAGPPGSRPPAQYSPGAPHRPQPGYRGEEDFPPRRPRRREEPSSTVALISLILGIASFCIPVVLSLVAIVMGVMGIMATGEGKRKGRGLAVAGLVLGIVSLFTGGIAGYFFLTGIQRVRLAAARVKSQNNLKLMSLAMHSYSDETGHLPQHAIYSKDRKPLLSWRVKILPYLNEGSLYNQFHLDEPWDSPHNKKLLRKMPEVYAHPLVDEEINEKGYTHYQVFVTPELEEFQSSFVRSPDVQKRPWTLPDGTSNTFLIVEATKPVPWTKPEDLTYSTSQPLPKVGLPVYSNKGFNAALANGSIRFIVDGEMSKKDMRNAITDNDGQPVDFP